MHTTDIYILIHDDIPINPYMYYTSMCGVHVYMTTMAYINVQQYYTDTDTAHIADINAIIYSNEGVV